MILRKMLFEKHFQEITAQPPRGQLWPVERQHRKLFVQKLVAHEHLSSPGTLPVLILLLFTSELPLPGLVGLTTEQ